MLSKGMHGDNMRMVKRRDQFGFTFETFGRLFARHRVSQYFQCDRSLKRNLFRSVDDPHRPLANLFDDLEIPQLLRNQIGADT